MFTIGDTTYSNRASEPMDIEKIKSGLAELEEERKKLEEKRLGGGKKGLFERLMNRLGYHKGQYIMVVDRSKFQVSYFDQKVPEIKKP